MSWRLIFLLLGLPCQGLAQPAPGSATKVAVAFSGGHATDGQDRGRPVVLIAAALNVPTEVFREAFSHVHPAPAGQQPEPGQARENKDALLHSLGSYGITNDRLDTVSNYYRYNRSAGEMWRHTSAAAYATVRDGTVTEITLTNSGSGYSSVPNVSLPGTPHVHFKVTLLFSTDFDKNGSIREIKIDPETRQP